MTSRRPSPNAAAGETNRPTRREFLQSTVAVTTAAVATTTVAMLDAQLIVAAQNDKPTAKPEPLVDVNVSLGRWPFRYLPTMQTPTLVAKLREQGVAQAWAGSFDALLHKDLAGVNARLAEECGRHADRLVPIGAINPLLPGWQEDLRRCTELHKMPGIRLHPNYHGYSLADESFERVLAAAVERNLFVQIAVLMEEERTIHRLVNVPATDVEPLAAAMKKFPTARVQLLNAFRTLRAPQAVTMASAGVMFEIATLEGVIGIEKLLEQLPLDKLCFGSNAPFFYFESAKLKLQESALAGVQHRAVCFENARRFMDVA